MSEGDGGDLQVHRSDADLIPKPLELSRGCLVERQGGTGREIVDQIEESRVSIHLPGSRPLPGDLRQPAPQLLLDGNDRHEDRSRLAHESQPGEEPLVCLPLGPLQQG